MDGTEEFTLQGFRSFTNQGKEAEHLSRERRSRWISAISRSDRVFR